MIMSLERFGDTGTQAYLGEIRNPRNYAYFTNMQRIPLTWGKVEQHQTTRRQHKHSMRLGNKCNAAVTETKTCQPKGAATQHRISKCARLITYTAWTTQGHVTQGRVGKNMRAGLRSILVTPSAAVNDCRKCPSNAPQQHFTA